MKFGNFKMNLQKKIFVLMLSVGVAAFIFMGIVAITGMYMVNNKINNAGQQMSENTSDADHETSRELPAPQPA